MFRRSHTTVVSRAGTLSAANPPKRILKQPGDATSGVTVKFNVTYVPAVADAKKQSGVFRITRVDEGNAAAASDPAKSKIPGENLGKYVRVERGADSLSVYAFVSSQWMLHPRGVQLRSRVFPLSPHTSSCVAFVETKETVPENVYLHLNLIAREKNCTQLRDVDVEIGKATLMLSALCKGTADVRLYDAHDPSWNIGSLRVTLHKDTAPLFVGKGLSMPRFNGLIQRQPTETKMQLAAQWSKVNYDSVWKRFRSAVMFPGGKLFRYHPDTEVVRTPDGDVPTLFYIYHASRFTAEDQSEFADGMARMGCIRAGVTVSQMMALKQDSGLLHTILCYTLSSLPLALGYCEDGRGSSYELPVAADSIQRVSGMCVEFSTLILVVARAIREGKSAICQKLKSVLDQFRVCAAMCTTRSGEVEYTPQDTIMRHLTVVLVPRKAVSALRNQQQSPPSSAETWHCYTVDSLEEVQPSPWLPVPGCVSEYEHLALKGVLPRTMSAVVAYDVKDPQTNDGPAGRNAFYRSCIKLYCVDGDPEELLELTCLSKSASGEWVVGIELRDFMCGGLSTDNHHLHCPLPLSSSSRAVSAFESDFQETLQLSNLYQQKDLPDYLTDEKVKGLVRSISELPRGVGWRIGFYTMRAKGDAAKLAEALDDCLGDVPLLAKKDRRSGIESADCEILGLINAVSGALSACVLMKYLTSGPPRGFSRSTT